MARFNYNHLRYFWAVAREGNLNRAARKLHVSASAVSVQIKKLEQELGHDLFERRGRELVLTEAGRITLDHADDIFATGDALAGILGDRADHTRAILRIGAVSTLSRNFQLRFLRPLIGRDDVEVVIRSGSLTHLLRRLEAHRLDVVLANSIPHRDAATSWVPHAVAEQPVSLVGPPPGRGRKRPTVDEALAQGPLILPTIESSIRTGLDAYLDLRGIVPTIAAEVDDMAMLRLLAREKIGYAVVPAIVVRDELRTRTLVEIGPIPDLVESFVAITASRRFPNPLLRSLLAADRTTELAGKLGGGGR